MRLGPTSTIYIFKAMDRQAGYRYLINGVGKLNKLDQIKSDQTVYWLLRESNSQKGLLTIDYIFWNNKENCWASGSQRAALHKAKGWINASNLEDPQVLEALKEIEQVTAETAVLHEKSLYEFISQLPNANLSIENRLNPSNEQQAVSGIFSKYININNSVAKESFGIFLMPGVIQALTC
ncbi:MAG TPA: hypothetical protein PLD88_03825, partial [Candidatus Berkiella sp.]|nr:hypothetical protein [Candidatus Berkiella sp.]